MCNIVNCVPRTIVAVIMAVISKAQLAAPNTIVNAAAMTVTRVPVLVGEVAELPCDVRPPLRNDSLLFVVWYRDDNPVYSYDTRISGPSMHWAEDAYLGRASWHNAPASGLKLLNVEAKDRATYQCRVDFHVSPTRNYKVTLDVIELPRKPVIYDAYGKELSVTAGPYQEGGSLKLTCTVKGGYPTPRVQWLKNGVSIKSLKASDHQESQETRSLTLEVLNLSRNDLDTNYTCTADNTILALPQKTTVTIDLYLQPLRVVIIPEEHALCTCRKTEFQCRSIGARPPAVITWWLEGKKINTATTISGSGDSGTKSILPLRPLKEHNGQILTCKAEQPTLNFRSIQSNITLEVFYPPEANISVADKVNPEYIEEGDDVHFNCKVDANPPADQVLWAHNDTRLYHNPSDGIIVTGKNNLTLQNVSRRHTGRYTCDATNIEGGGKSPELFIHVVYRPQCKRRDVYIMGAALQEDTTVICEVEALPPPTSFEWSLNNSAGTIKVDSHRFTIEEKVGRSVLTYTPVSDIDYGTLECRARNAVGQQLSPCVYTMLPASKPQPPNNCTVYNLTYDSLDLLCQQGYEGGLQCIYVVEAWANEGLAVNTSNEAPLWNLRRLGSNRQLRLIIYAVNARGRSEHISFTVTTRVKIIAKEPLDMREWELSWAVGVFLGAVITVAIILCLAFIAARIRDRSRDYEVNIPTVKNQTIIVPARSSQAQDKNSDLIPLSKGMNAPPPPDPPRYSDIEATDQFKNPGYAHSTLRIHPPNMPATTHPHYSDLQNDAVRFVVNAMTRPHREIVTTRTQLLPHRESFV